MLTADTGDTPRTYVARTSHVRCLVHGIRLADNTEVDVGPRSQAANQMEGGAPRRSAISPRGACLLA
jgi:hypothetical protein